MPTWWFAKEGIMQVFTLCFLFLAASLLLVPGIALSRQSGNFRNTAASSMSRRMSRSMSIHQAADREQWPIRTANIFQQNFSSKRLSIAAALAVDVVERNASKIGGRPKASQ
jgi:hypothetical protein